MFNFFKKKEDSPPDIGREDNVSESADSVKEESGIDGENYEEDSAPVKESKKSTKKKSAGIPNQINNISLGDNSGFQFERINAKIEALDAFIKGLNERFSIINQQIGEIRSMNIANEKSILKSTQDAMKTVDIVNEVKPDKLRLDYQRLDAKFSEYSERLEANKQMTDTIMEEIKDLRRKAGIFVGTDALLKLNENVKKDLVEIQKTASRVKMNADKSEGLFIELKKGFSENEKLNELINTLDSNYSALTKTIEKLKLDFSNVVNQNDFNDYRNKMSSKLSMYETAFLEVQKQKKENERLGNLIETIFALAKRNEQDIADIGITIGHDKLKKVSDYEEEIATMLRLMDSFAGEISKIKRFVGIKKEESASGSDNKSETKDLKISTPEPVKSKGIEKTPLPETEKPVETEELPSLENEENSLPESDKAFPITVELPSLEDEKIKTDKIPLVIKETPLVLANKNPEKIYVQNESSVLKKEFRKNISDKVVNYRNLRIELERKISDLLWEGGYALMNNDLKMAIDVYKKISQTYNPNYDRNKTIYYKILKFYDNLLRLTGHQAIIKRGDSEKDVVYFS